MNEITNHAELTVEKKLEGKYLLNRILMISAYIAVPVLVFFLFAFLEDNAGLTGGGYISVFFIPIWAFLCPKVVLPFTYLYVDIEEKMDVSGGNLTLTRIYGKRKPVEYIKVKVADLDAIIPYREEASKKQIAAFGTPDRVIECVSSMSHPDVYCAYYTDEKGKKVVMYFEAVEKALKVFKFLNSKTVVVPVSR